MTPNLPAQYSAARKPKARKARKAKNKTTLIRPATGTASGCGTAAAVGAAIAAAVGVAKVTAPKKGRGRPRKDSTVAGLKLLQENPSVHGAAKRTAASTGESSE